VGWSVAAVALGFAGIVTTVFFFKAYNFSRLAAGAAWGFNTVLVAGWRLGARLGLRKARLRGVGKRRVLVVGTDEEAARFVELMGRHPGLDAQLVGLVAASPELRGTQVAGAQVVGLVEELPGLVREYKVDELIFTSATISHSLQQVGRRRRQLRLRMLTGSLTEADQATPPASLDDLPLVEVTPRRSA
jgi:FlaA1/EpsC-like NDP-sugar epimerase